MYIYYETFIKQNSKCLFYRKSLSGGSFCSKNLKKLFFA